MKTTQTAFAGALGETLSARLDEPDSKARAYLIFSHCFTYSKDLPVVRRISEAMTEHGIDVLRFDFFGLGQSEGKFDRREKGLHFCRP